MAVSRYLKKTTPWLLWNGAAHQADKKHLFCLKPKNNSVLILMAT